MRGHMWLIKVASVLGPLIIGVAGQRRKGAKWSTVHRCSAIKCENKKEATVPLTHYVTAGR